MILLSAGAAAGLAFSLAFWATALAWARGLRRRQPPPPDRLPPVTILKPVRGRDADTPANFESYGALAGPGVQVLFGVGADEDAAVPVIRDLQAAFPDRDIGLVVARARRGTNPKVRILGDLLDHAKHDLLVIADGDTRVGPGYLEAVLAPFADPAVGCATCLYRNAGGAGLGQRLEALTVAVDFIPSVLVAERLQGATFALGATVAVRRRALEAIGGFAALADHVADDFVIGRWIHRAGYRVHLASYVVEHRNRLEGLADSLRHQLRWARTTRSCQPAGYLGTILTNSTLLAGLFVLSQGFAPAALAGALGAVGIRMALGALFARRVLGDRASARAIWLLPLRDLIGAGIWAASLAGSRIIWAGRAYRLVRDGRLVPLPGSGGEGAP